MVDRKRTKKGKNGKKRIAGQADGGDGNTQGVAYCVFADCLASAGRAYDNGLAKPPLKNICCRSDAKNGQDKNEPVKKNKPFLGLGHTFIVSHAIC